MWGSCEINKAEWLFVVHSLVKCVVEEGIIDVELMYGPRARDGNVEHNTNGRGFNNRAKGFIEIDARLLRIAMSNPTGFVLENTLVDEDIGTQRTWNK